MNEFLSVRKRRQGGGGKFNYDAAPSWNSTRDLFHHQGAAVVSCREQSSRFLFATLRCWLMIVLSVAWLTACETAPSPEDTGPRTHSIHVTSNGWHTAIVVPAPVLVATNTLPEIADFPDAAFLEFGWGDRTYYPAKKPTLSMALTAAFVPTSAVMHMAGLQAPPKESTGLEVISVELTESGFRRLSQALAAEFERPSGGRAESVSRGLYSNSYFYHAHGKFHLFNTCNTWTARMLRKGGVALFSSSGIITADALMTRLRESLAVE